MILALALAALNPAVTQATIASTICVPGYTRTIRPPESYTSRIKRRLVGPFGDMRAYQLDHVVPLGVGGAPRDPRNLALQPIKAALAKDADERRVRALVCGGRWTLQRGQGYFVRRWGK